MRRIGRILLYLACACLLSPQAGRSEEAVDKLDRQRLAADAIARMTMRVRVTHCEPPAKELAVHFRRGGEGLGGTVVHGKFAPAAPPVPDIDLKLAQLDTSPYLTSQQWSIWIPVDTVTGRVRGWEFPTITVNYPPSGKPPTDPPREVTVEFEFADRGKVFQAFSESAPQGATVGFAFPGALVDERGGARAEFRQALQGLYGHARTRRERLEKLFPEPWSPPQEFGLLGHLGGYGDHSGFRSPLGYGTRHCNPAILAEECRAMQFLGVNGLVDSSSLQMADIAGLGRGFRRVFWGGPGSGSPMSAVSSDAAGEADGCPFDPRLQTTMGDAVSRAITEHKSSGASEKWALWWDEMGVAVKGHMNDCSRCRDRFRQYLQSHQIAPDDVGATSWEEVRPYPLWTVETAHGKTRQSLAAPPVDRADRLRYYYTYRFMTHATANLFPESAQRLKDAGIRLYAMQGPTPSWAGSSLDWHEFYDYHANTAIVWETSNRDARTWQWESYLADIARGISLRHEIPIGCLVKPHRGAPQQRMLSVVARGTRAIEWYTYGPDYSKGDSFSQSPQLLEDVARAARFLAAGEKWLARATWTSAPDVALVFPRSSEIWSRGGDLGVTPLEDAKWVYLALRHAHIPVDILSEQQLTENAVDRYKVLYVVGPNLRHDAMAKVAAWVHAGGILWTDALGLARDEADQPSALADELLAVGPRRLESWGETPAYGATALALLKDKDAPASAIVTWKSEGEWGSGELRAVVGREPLAVPDGAIVARFADGAPAVAQRQVGKGQIVVVGMWAGLTYSARVRRADFNMTTDFDPAARRLIVAAALQRGVDRPVVPDHPLVEAVALRNEAGRSVALVNWTYRRDEEPAQPARLQPAHDLRVRLPAAAASQRVRSLQSGELAVRSDHGQPYVILPTITTVDLLIFEP